MSCFVVDLSGFHSPFKNHLNVNFTFVLTKNFNFVKKKKKKRCSNRPKPSRRTYTFSKRGLIKELLS